MKHCGNRNELVPYDVIESAVHGNSEAMNAILKHYAGYILSLSSQHGFDRQGFPQSWIDDTIRKRLETRLIIATLRFDLT